MRLVAGQMRSSEPPYIVIS